MRVATFRESSDSRHSPGLDYVAGVFHIEGAGATTVEHVGQLDRNGELAWVSQEVQAWFWAMVPENKVIQSAPTPREPRFSAILAYVGATAWASLFLSVFGAPPLFNLIIGLLLAVPAVYLYRRRNRTPAQGLRLFLLHSLGVLGVLLLISSLSGGFFTGSSPSGATGSGSNEEQATVVSIERSGFGFATVEYDDNTLRQNVVVEDSAGTVEVGDEVEVTKVGDIYEIFTVTKHKYRTQ